MPNPDQSIRAQIVPAIRAAGIRKTAHHLGLHHSTLLGWMKGTRSVSAETVDRLAGYLGLVVRIEECHGPPAPPNPPPPP